MRSVQPAIVAACAFAMSVVIYSRVSKPEVPSVQRSPFIKQTDAAFEKLERDFSRFPIKLEYEEVSACKKTVRESLEAIRSEEDAKYFVAKVANTLATGDKFRFFEYYLLWLGHRAIEKHPIQNLRAWDGLVTKITGAKNFSPHRELNDEIAAFGIETMLAVFPYSEKSPIENEGAINWTQWQSMEKWYRSNRERFKFSAADGKFVLPSSTNK